MKARDGRSEVSMAEFWFPGSIIMFCSEEEISHCLQGDKLDFDVTEFSFNSLYLFSLWNFFLLLS